ncbi:MAG TPA: MFS transporter [Acidimicrobiia bacterium]|nr:MFS transporter [Acidimicrobiia bacterium]
MPDVRPAHAPRHRPLPPRPFAPLAFTHVISTAAEAFLTVALAGTLFFTVSPASARPRVALFLVLTMAPFAVVAPVLGPLMDRSKSGRRIFVVVTCAARAVLALMMARHRHSLALYPEAFGVLVLSKGYSVAKSSIVPSVVEGDDALVAANSRLALLAVFGSFVGGLPGAALLHLVGGEWSLRMAALMYAAAAVVALRLPRGTARPPEKTDLARAELRAATVLLSATAMAALRAAVGFLTFFLAFALKRSGEPAWVFGLVIAASAIGGLIGALAAPMARLRLREEWILATSVMTPAILSLFAARNPTRPLLALAALSVGAGAAAGKLAFESIVQRDAPDADRSRAFARFETRFQLVWVGGGLLPVAIVLPERLGLFLMSVTLAFFGLSYVGAVRAAHRFVHPAPDAPAPDALPPASRGPAPPPSPG